MPIFEQINFIFHIYCWVASSTAYLLVFKYHRTMRVDKYIYLFNKYFWASYSLALDARLEIGRQQISPSSWGFINKIRAEIGEKELLVLINYAPAVAGKGKILTYSISIFMFTSLLKVWFIDIRIYFIDIREERRRRYRNINERCKRNIDLAASCMPPYWRSSLQLLGIYSD